MGSLLQPLPPEYLIPKKAVLGPFCQSDDPVFRANGNGVHASGKVLYIPLFPENTGFTRTLPLQISGLLRPPFSGRHKLRWKKVRHRTLLKACTRGSLFFHLAFLPHSPFPERSASQILLNSVVLLRRKNEKNRGINVSFS